MIFFFFYTCSLAALACLSGCGGGHFSPGKSGQVGKVTLFGNVGVSTNQKVFRKGNLEFLSLGRNRDEVEALLGTPEKLISKDGILVDWEYRLAIYDEVTQVVFKWSRVILTFETGLCSNVLVDLQQPPTPDDIQPLQLD